ncbi:MAG: hypothetical protein HXX10_02255 [Rhodoplanes sp.]|uniref:hypothetical protein n=1 Tax=Rhodoplanes sp. TaxID=1968906 RepID=UPI0018569606|nr:hypothetical protein [Rhodoplanes sp.]NVO12836.1 hypothetical protein [Rhodoplanes sp.]
MDGDSSLVLVELILALAVVFGFAFRELATLRRPRAPQPGGDASAPASAPVRPTARSGRPPAR